MVFFPWIRALNLIPLSSTESEVTTSRIFIIVVFCLLVFIITGLESVNERVYHLLDGIFIKVFFNQVVSILQELKI